MSQTEFVTKIDSRGSVNIPKALQEAGYTTGIKVHVILEIVNEQLSNNGKPREKGEGTAWKRFANSFCLTCYIRVI